MYDLRALGHYCKNQRRRMQKTQKQVAIETGYTEKTISAFECGRINNARLLCWYIDNGLNKDLIKGCYYGK